MVKFPVFLISHTHSSCRMLHLRCPVSHQETGALTRSLWSHFSAPSNNSPSKHRCPFILNGRGVLSMFLLTSGDAWVATLPQFDEVCMNADVDSRHTTCLFVDLYFVCVGCRGLWYRKKKWVVNEGFPFSCLFLSPDYSDQILNRWV